MKQFYLCAVSICVITSMLNADTTNNKSQKTSSDQTPQMNQITPSANPIVTHWCDPYLTAEFLWWRVQEDGLTFAYSGAAPLTGGDTIAASKGHIHQVKFHYEPGFKVGFGLKFKHDGWDLYANYTWIRTNFSDTKNTVRTSSGSTMYSTYSAFGPIGVGPLAVVEKASGEWSLRFNALDLELGRNYWISPALTLRPHFGMKFSWIDQEYDLKYNNAVGAIEDGSNYRIYNDQDEFAVGLRTGLDAAWYMWSKWCVFGEFAASALWNDFDVKRKDRTQTPAGVSLTSFHSSRSSHTVTAVLELALGLRFETTFHNDDYLFKLQAGWEEQVWFNQNQMFDPINNVPQNLTFEGLTIKAGFDF